MEKAHPDVHELFIQPFDNGFMARATRLLQELQVAHGDGSSRHRLSALARPDVLMLDELAIALNHRARVAGLA